MKISIVVPAYNEARGIEMTVQQFILLTIPHEVIVSDTASTDDTVAIAKRFINKVITLPEGGKRGVSYGRNNGAKVAEGEFIVFLDCDTIIPDPDTFFKTVIARFEKNKELVGVSCRIEVNKLLSTWSDRSVSTIMNLYFAFLNNVIGMGMASGKFMMVRTDAFNKIKGFNENLSTAEDIEFFARLAKIGQTEIMLNLEVFHSGRRFHKLGAWRTMFGWMKNAVLLWLFKKSSDKWDPVR